MTVVEALKKWAEKNGKPVEVSILKIGKKRRKELYRFLKLKQKFERKSMKRAEKIIFKLEAFN